MSYTKTNVREVEDSAPKFDMPAEMQARFARRAIEGETLGLSLFTLEPGFRIPFGHKHESQEEVYVVVRGSARVKVDDEVVELAEWDAIRNYTGGRAFADALVSHQDEIREILTGIDGFRAYYLLRTVEGATTISVFATEDGAQESTSAAAAWVGENLGNVSPDPPHF